MTLQKKERKKTSVNVGRHDCFDLTRLYLLVRYGGLYVAHFASNTDNG